MRQAGSITYQEQICFEGVFLLKIQRITFTGQDFYNAVEKNELWNKAKDAMKKKGLKVGEV